MYRKYVTDDNKQKPLPQAEAPPPRRANKQEPLPRAAYAASPSPYGGE